MDAGRSAGWKLLGAPSRTELEFIRDALRRDISEISFGPAYESAREDRNKAWDLLNRIIRNAPHD